MRAAILPLALAVSACVTAPKSPDNISSFVAVSLPGAYSNETQFAAAPARLKRPPAAGFPYEWVDQQFATFARVDAPGIGTDVYYLEWRATDKNGPISRQRIWSFRVANNAVRMDFFTFKDPKPFEGKASVAGAFNALSPTDLIGYGPDCGLFVSQSTAKTVMAKTTPESCSLTARSGRKMGIDAEVVLSREQVTYREAGILEDGSFAFKVPGGPAYFFVRQP